MAAPSSPRLEFENLPGLANLQVSKIITTPKGSQFRAVVTGNNMTLVNQAGGGIIVVTGPVTADVSISGIIGGALDGILDVLKALKGLVSCTPTQTT